MDQNYSKPIQQRVFTSGDVEKILRPHGFKFKTAPMNVTGIDDTEYSPGKQLRRAGIPRMVSIKHDLYRPETGESIHAIPGGTMFEDNIHRWFTSPQQDQEEIPWFGWQYMMRQIMKARIGFDRRRLEKLFGVRIYPVRKPIPYIGREQETGKILWYKEPTNA